MEFVQGYQYSNGRIREGRKKEGLVESRSEVSDQVEVYGELHSQSDMALAELHDYQLGFPLR